MNARDIWQHAYSSGATCPYPAGSNEAEIWQSGLDARLHDTAKSSPRKRARDAVERRIATIDFETDPAGSGRRLEPFAWGFYDGSIYKDFWGNDAPATLIEWIRSLDESHVIYAHNGGKFDFQFIVQYLDADVFFIGSRIVKATVKGCKVPQEIRDSLAIIPVPLKDAAEKFAFDYDKMLAGRRDKHRKEILQYLKQDCVGLFDIVMKYRETFGNALTMSSAAMKKLNLAMCPAGQSNPKAFRVYDRLTEKQDAELRQWYFGGRVQCFEKGIIKRKLKIYDITSSYPYAMLSYQHPVGNQFEITRKITPLTDFALIDATSYGALPIRAEDGALTFPHGRYIFHAGIHEIRMAEELGLLHIHKVVHARECRKKTNFKAFIDLYYSLRLAAAQRGDEVFKLFWKLVMNGAYGKFAQNPRKFKDHILWLLDAEENDNDAPSVDHGWRPEFMTDSFMIYARKTEECFPGSNAKSYLNVATGASITSAARAQLMAGLAAATGPVYCDTDSIICEELPASLIHENQLGKWKIEATGNMIAVCEKKLYAFFGEKSNDPKVNAKRIKDYGDATCIKIASKGVRLSAHDMLDVARGETVEYMPTFPTIKPDGRQIYIPRKIKMRR